MYTNVSVHKCHTPINSTRAEALFEVIDECLRKRRIDITTLKCVSFDGAAVMSSPVNGLYGIMMSKWKLPHLIFQHCRAHLLQLVGRAAAKNSHQVELALGTAQALYTYFHRSNKKLELLREISRLDPEFDGYVRRLIEVAPTRWLSYSQAIGRLLKVYVNISLTLDCMQNNLEFSADDRARSAGLLGSMLSREVLATLVFMDIILGKLSSLSCVFQSTQVSLQTAIQTTRATMSEIARFTKKADVLEVIEPDVEMIIRKLEDVGLKVNLSGRGRRLREETDNIDGLCTYIEGLLSEINRRFNTDTEILVTMKHFCDESWPDSIPMISAKFGFDEGSFRDEGKNMKRHCEHSTVFNELDNKDREKAFWLAFASDPYTRAMYPEHTTLAVLLLTMPLGSCAVERCFSYTTRIASDSRAALTGDHISALVRISQEGPLFPTMKEIVWPLGTSQVSTSESQMNNFLEKVFAKWRMSPRRL